MTNPQQAAKQRGAKFEIDVMKWLRTKGATVERLRLAGKQDEGDLSVVVAGKTFVLELKNTKRMDLPEFWRQAQVEAVNYAKSRGITDPVPAYVVVKRRNAGIDQAWVITSLEAWLEREQ